MITRIIVLLFVLYGNLTSAPADESKFFPKKGTDFGVYYYPEHWSEDQWERDISRIGKLGFTFIHVSEFAWQRIEPADGQFDFTWLDKVVDLADRNGLKVLMSTPASCIPSWLATQHPEVLLVDANGRRVLHNGARLTGSLANPIYQKYVSRVVSEMAKRYGKDPRINGWQIGNEPHIQSGNDFSPSAHQAFIAWLKRKYVTIDAVNASWGGPFWSYSFSSFDEIQVPYPNMPGPNPHTWLDFETYTSEEIARDLIDQAKVLRQHTRSEQWITTNYAYFKGLHNVNPFLTRKDHDFASHTMYLTTNLHNSAEDSMSHRLGRGMELCLAYELAKSVSGYTGIMELQPGQINWGRFNAMPLPGAVRMWVWHAFALGNRFVCTYRYRQPLFGTEQFHHGIMQTDGTSLSRGGAEFVQAIKETTTIAKELEPGKEHPFVRSTRTAFLWGGRNIIDIENYPHHRDWDTWQHLYTYYQGLKRMGVNVDFVQEDDPFSPDIHPFMVVPAYQLMSLELITKLETYAKQGGHLIITTRSGLKDSRGHLWETKIQQPIWNLIGGEIEFYDHLPKNLSGKVKLDGKSYPWHLWGTVTNPSKGTASWGVYEDQFYQGKSAISNHSLGKGTVTYAGVWSNDWELEYQLLRRVYSKSAKLPFDLPPYVFAHYRQGLWFAVNYTDKPITLPLPPDAKILTGQTKLLPAAVLVWVDAPQAK